MSKYFLLFSLFIFGMQFSFAQCGSYVMTVTGYNPTCYNYNDGAVTAITSGGNGSDDFTITDSLGTEMSLMSAANNLSWGWYFIHVIDDLGCELYDSVFLVNPLQLDPVVYFTDPSSLSACDGTAEVDTVLNYQGDYNLISYFWLPGGPGGLGQTIKTDLCNEYFTLTINDEFGCSLVADLSIGSASIPSHEKNKTLTLFPNPFSESTTIQVDPIYFGETIYITNQLGEIVKVIPINTETLILDRDNLPNGIYFFSLGNQQGKFVIQ
jgi:hypothetical protein